MSVYVGATTKSFWNIFVSKVKELHRKFLTFIFIKGIHFQMHCVRVTLIYFILEMNVWLMYAVGGLGL